MSATPEAVQADIFSRERAGITEMLTSALHPSAHWHDPREARVPRHPGGDMTPFAQSAAEAIIWLRKHPAANEHPAAAAALWCMVMRENCAAQMLAVATALARRWRRQFASVRKMAWESRELGEVERAAEIVVIRCTSGVLTDDRPRLQAHLWRWLQNDGIDAVWGWADTAASRARRALR